MRRPKAITVALVFMLLAPMLAAWTPARAQDATPAADCPVTTEEENQAIIQRYYDIVAAYDLDALGEVLAPVVYQHAVDVMDGRGLEEVKANLAFFTEAFPDLQFEIDQWVTDGEFVAARVIQSGTHEGDFVGIPATGVEATWSVIGIWRIECGLITEQWVEVDSIGRLVQLGAFEMPGSSDPATPGAAVEDTATETAAGASPPAECPDTSEEENEALVRRWYDEVLSQANFDLVAELTVDDYVHHRVLSRETQSAAEREASLRENRAALPDLHTTVDLVLSEGDRVVARWTATGTHEGPWVGIEPTGQPLTWTGITIFRVECGRLAEQWSESDTLGVFEQMGILEWPPAATEASPAAG